MSQSESVIVERRQAVGRVIFNRPEQLNAINDEMGERFHAALREFEKSPDVRCIILTGAGRAFSAGEDVSGLKERSEASKRENDQSTLGDHLRKKYHPIILRMRNMEKPIIAQLNGIAAGSGASLALACDFRIASEEAGLKQAFIGIGLVPDSGSSYFLTRTIGPALASELMMTGRTMSAKEAESLGLVHKVVSKEELAKTTDEMAELLASGPTKAIGMIKKLVNRAGTVDLAEALEYEALHQDIAGKTLDHLEAVKAFLEKRRAKFVGH